MAPCCRVCDIRQPLNARDFHERGRPRSLPCADSSRLSSWGSSARLFAAGDRRVLGRHARTRSVLCLPKDAPYFGPRVHGLVGAPRLVPAKHATWPSPASPGLDRQCGTWSCALRRWPSRLPGSRGCLAVAPIGPPRPSHCPSRDALTTGRRGDAYYTGSLRKRRRRNESRSHPSLAQNPRAIRPAPGQSAWPSGSPSKAGKAAARARAGGSGRAHRSRP